MNRTMLLCLEHVRETRREGYDLARKETSTLLLTLDLGFQLQNSNWNPMFCCKKFGAFKLLRRKTISHLHRATTFQLSILH